MGEPSRRAVLDASVAVELLTGRPLVAPVRARLEGVTLHAPTHLDAECLSALGRLHRAEALSTDQVHKALGHLAGAPITRHPLTGLLASAWALRERIRLADALYVALADELDVPLLTTDARLARATSRAELIDL